MLVGVKTICNNFHRYERLAVFECVLAPSIYGLSMAVIIWCCANNPKGIKAESNSLTGYVTGFNVVALPAGTDESNAFAGDSPRADSDSRC